jgi:alkylation response protein AidB-like acyl-CoA dehydrogenase
MSTITAPPAPRSADRWTTLVASLAPALAAGAPDRDRTGILDPAVFDELRAAGLTSALVPAELGGGGASHDEMGQILRGLGAADPSVAVTLAMHSHLVAAQVWRHRHGQDATPVLQKVAGGAILISTGASDWVGSNGRVERVDGGYVVHARKAPASGCEVGDILITSLRWDDAPNGPQVLHAAVPFSAPGVSIEQTWDTLGLRATGSHTVVLDGVLIPEATVSLQRPADVWHPVWNTVCGVALPLIMSAYLGIADAAVTTALQIASGRSDAHVLQTAGEMVNAHVTASDAVAAMYASSQDFEFENTDDHASRTLARKTVATDACIATVRLAIELSSGAGYSRSTDLERLLRDVHGSLFHPLPRAKQTTFSGRVALGLPPVG